MNNIDQHDFITGSEIAVIGMSCRFPGAKNVDEFWQNLKNGVSSISSFSDDELLESGIDTDMLKNPNYVKASGVIPDIEMFDAQFFNFTPREAETTDPQRRIFLECAWEAMENAGYRTGAKDDSTGVYAGVGMNFYLLKNLYTAQRFLTTGSLFQLMIRNEKDFLPLQTCYKLNLKGPGVNIQSACSTSLVAVHFACQSLLNGEIDMALAGGVSLQVPQKSGYLYEQGMVLSPDGHCRTFDAKAKGTVFGSGCGIVVLKRLEDAVNDSDSIYAVIKGSAINNDGSIKVGYTAPGVEGQASVISEAQAVAQINPETITYIEAHGTGTTLGDPVEISALTQAFRHKTPKKEFCAIGSVKSNLGHLDAAAGAAGLIKTALALKNKAIPQSLDFKEPNPDIDFENSPFYVNTKLSEWKTDNMPRRAGVSSFGIGGTNAHIVLEEAPQLDISKTLRTWHLLTLSAKTETALNRAAANLAGYLKENPDIDLADVAYTLQVGRMAFGHRMFLVCQNTNEAAAKLESGKDVSTGFYEPGKESGPQNNTSIDESFDFDTKEGLSAIGNQWLAHVKVDWAQFYKHARCHRIPLPTYPFERQRYWIEPAKQKESYREKPDSQHPRQAMTKVAREKALTKQFDKQPDIADFSPAHQRPELTTQYIPPQNKTEQTLVDIWRDILGIEKTGIRDDFFELGGDSLLAVQAVSEINRLFSTNLSTHSLLDAPTISEIAGLIESDNSAEGRSLSLLVRLQKGNRTKPPLFLIHPVGGHVYFYRDIAKYLASDQPVYGIRAQGTEEEAEPLTKIEDMARQYIGEIRTMQPEGPYFVGGSSFGGIVAFEIAQQLSKVNQKTAILAMIDTPGQGHMTKGLDNDAAIIAYLLELGSDISVSEDSIRKLDPDAQLSYFIEQMKQVNKTMLLSENLMREQIRNFIKLFKLNIQSMKSYMPQVYSGKIIFFRAKERDDFIPHHPEKAWLNFAAKGMKIHEVPGNHITMNESPHVQVIAKHLKEYIEKALPKFVK